MLLDVGTLTAIHLALSFIALVFGVVAVLSLFSSQIPRLSITTFLILAVSTTLTGFLFPFQSVTPAFLTGIVSCFILCAVLFAQYVGQFKHVWRTVYASGIVASAYLLVFVTIAQAFNKTTILQEAAPSLSGGLFAVSQLMTLAVFIFLGLKSVKAFKPDSTGNI
jgi:hypothetical protein